MSTGSNETTTDKPEVQEIQADIARTREELAETVDALTARLDVKARARQRVQDTKDQAAARVRSVRGRATTEEGKPTPAVLGAGGGLVAVITGLVALIVWRRRR